MTPAGNRWGLFSRAPFHNDYVIGVAARRAAGCVSDVSRSASPPRTCANSTTTRHPAQLRRRALIRVKHSPWPAPPHLRSPLQSSNELLRSSRLRTRDGLRRAASEGPRGQNLCVPAAGFNVRPGVSSIRGVRRERSEHRSAGLRGTRGHAPRILLSHLRGPPGTPSSLRQRFRAPPRSAPSPTRQSPLGGRHCAQIPAQAPFGTVCRSRNTCLS